MWTRDLGRRYRTAQLSLHPDRFSNASRVRLRCVTAQCPALLTLFVSPQREKQYSRGHSALINEAFSVLQSPASLALVAWD